MEFLLLEHTYRWLKPGGVLVLVIPGDRLSTCAEILAVHYERQHVALREGDVLVMYTDGVTEALNSAGKEFGEARLRDAVTSALDLPAPTSSRNG